MTVTNPATGVATASLFTINKGPAIDSISPASRLQGSAAATVTIDGANFVSGASLDLGADVNVSGVTFVNSGRLTATVSVNPGAAIGARTVGLEIHRASEAIARRQAEGREGGATRYEAQQQRRRGEQLE